MYREKVLPPNTTVELAQKGHAVHKPNPQPYHDIEPASAKLPSSYHLLSDACISYTENPVSPTNK